MRYPLIVFDFDGTLVDTFQLAMEVFNGLAPSHGFTPITDYGAARNEPTRAFFKRHGIRVWHLGKFVKTFQTEMRKRADGIEMIAGLKAVLDELRASGHRLGILSSNAEDHIRERLRAFGVEDRFEFILSYPKLFGKGRMLKKVAKRTGIDRTAIAYVGDEVRDMEAARKAGVHAFAVTWGYHSEELLATRNPDRMARRPVDLLDFVREAVA